MSDAGPQSAADELHEWLVREELVELLREAGCLELLRSYARETGDRRDAPAVLRTALTEALGAVLALRAESNRRPLGRASESGRTDVKQSVGTSGAKGPEVTPIARRRVLSRPIGRCVDG